MGRRRYLVAGLLFLVFLALSLVAFAINNDISGWGLIIVGIIVSLSSIKILKMLS